MVRISKQTQRGLIHVIEMDLTLNIKRELSHGYVPQVMKLLWRFRYKKGRNIPFRE